jgi:hypothetical protein
MRDLRQGGPVTSDQRAPLARQIPCDQAVCAGQDGSHATGCPSDGPDGSGRFADHGDGTVTDTCTGLSGRRKRRIRTAMANRRKRTSSPGVTRCLVRKPALRGP